jgi:hypothetical protein
MTSPYRSWCFSLGVVIATLAGALAASTTAAAPLQAHSVEDAKGCSDFPIEDVRALSGLYRHAASADHLEVRKLLCVLPKLYGGELEYALVALGEAMIVIRASCCGPRSNMK